MKPSTHMWQAMLALVWPAMALSRFESQHIFPHVVAEFDDSALLKLFGSEGFGIFCAPSAIAEHVAQQYQVVKCGEAPEIKERFYALTSKNQAAQGIVKAVINEAKSLLIS